MNGKNNVDKLVQIPIPIELYAKVCQYAAENRRSPRQQMIFDIEKIYFNVNLNDFFAEKFGLSVKSMPNVGLRNNDFLSETVNLGTQDEKEELL